MRKPHTRKRKAPKTFVGLDGEGQNVCECSHRGIVHVHRSGEKLGACLRGCGCSRYVRGEYDHRYVLLAYSDATGTRTHHIENFHGITTPEFLDFLLAIPADCSAFTFAFNYDLTKGLTDVWNEILHLLFRPEDRSPDPTFFTFGNKGPQPVEYCPPGVPVGQGYLLNLIGTKFTVKRHGVTRVVWDVFKFFQSKFTAALEDWKVGTQADIDAMRLMKDQRQNFDELDDADVRRYCLDECAKMAALAEKLTRAHEDAGLKLTSYYGAGSSAAAMLGLMAIKAHPRATPDGMALAVAMAFFGGRFENSVIGSLPGRAWSYDISSAYPYQLTFLPCLACGTWRQVTRRRDIDRASAALVRYRLRKPRDPLSWGPFPFRMGKGDEEGSIVYPESSGGGWVWRDEYLAGEKYFPNVEFLEAWIYETPCNHRPFERIPEWYLARLRIGKEGPGIVYKLAMNSCYGKLAQSVGDAPPFQCWIWAGMITSGCRAQLLDLLGLHKDRRSLLMVATDGAYTRERLTLPKPIDTGTLTDHKKPLGGWEEKEVPKGLFAARPGIYFPLNPTDDELKQVRARGVGRAVMYGAWKTLVEAWNQKKETVSLSNVVRFHGAKSTISRGILKENGQVIGHVFKRSPLYGQWAERAIELSFDPLPKREGVRKDGTLRVRAFDDSLTSAPYKKGVECADTVFLQSLQEELAEQPDGDFTSTEWGG